jgi:transglutaminase-like putative cysteine protease
MQKFLQACASVNWQEPNVLAQAELLARGRASPFDIARACFEFVRDEISHSWDKRQNPVTLRASDVLAHRTGYCYAKSHLLAALLRANGLPAALCYQRLTITDEPPFCLHGLNAVCLPDIGWYRLDARGNKQGINAVFNPPAEHLAFKLLHAGEIDVPGRYAEPLAAVVNLLQDCSSVQAVFERLEETDAF